jgi:nuclear pore complex protein Nup98-Nup96
MLSNVNIYFFFFQGQLFEGLEEDDFSFGNDSFVPRRSIKKLVIKSHDSRSSSGRKTPETASQDGEKEMVSNLHTQFLASKESETRQSFDSPAPTNTYKTSVL